MNKVLAEIGKKEVKEMEEGNQNGRNTQLGENQWKCDKCPMINTIEEWKPSEAKCPACNKRNQAVAVRIQDQLD